MWASDQEVRLLVASAKRISVNLISVSYEEIMRKLLNSIKDTWSNTAVVKEARARLEETRNAKESKQQKRDFEFVLNDQRTCYTLSDFRNDEARKKVQWWLETKKDLASRTAELNRLRDRYAAAAENHKAQFAPQIRLNEEKIEQMLQDLHNQEKEIRNIELNP